MLSIPPSIHLIFNQISSRQIGVNRDIYQSILGRDSFETLYQFVTMHGFEVLSLMASVCLVRTLTAVRNSLWPLMRSTHLYLANEV